jgi:hypothetical protein
MSGGISPYPTPSVDSAVTTGDVDGIRQFLEGFNGDFHALFGPSNGMARG